MGQGHFQSNVSGHKLLPSLGHRNYRLDPAAAKISTLTGAGAICQAMGLNVGTNSPTAAYICNAVSLPILNVMASPTSDLDTNVGTGPSAFRVVGPNPLAKDFGVTYADNVSNTIRCSSDTENNATTQSVTVLAVQYVNVQPSAIRGYVGKKGDGSAATAGYAVKVNGSGQPVWLYADGTTLNSVASTQWPTGWNVVMGSSDRAAVTHTIYSSWASSSSIALTATNSNTNAITFRSNGGGGSANIGLDQFFICVWIGSAAEGINQTHLNNLKTFLGI